MAQVLSTKRKQILDCISESVRGPRLSALGARDRRVGRPHLLVDGPRPSGRAPARGLPAAGPHQAPGHRGLLRPVVQGDRRLPADPPRAPRRRRGRRYRRPGPGEHRGALPPARGLHRDGLPVHAPGQGRLDDRRRHRRGRLRGRPPAARGPERATIVVAGIPDEEATVKTFSTRDGKVVLTPANARLEPMVFDPAEVTVFGKVVTVMRRL